MLPGQPTPQLLANLVSDGPAGDVTAETEGADRPPDPPMGGPGGEAPRSRVGAALVDSYAFSSDAQVL